jgi:hypothetical protein
LGAIRGEAALAVKPENVLDSVRLIELASRSAASGESVRL